MAFNPNKAAEDLGYRLTECLGNGGFGQVWKAEPKEGVGDPVAIKFISNAGARDSKALHAMAEQGVNHPNTVDILALREMDDWLVVVMTFCETTLRDRLKECVGMGEEGIPPRELLIYMEQVADALDFFLDNKISHRDVKPQNIFLSSGLVRLGDPGISKVSGDSQGWQQGYSVAPYAAPEIDQGIETTTSDQYSLALSYYELRSGKFPFEGKPINEIQSEKKLETLPLVGLRPNEEAVLRRALSAKPEGRYSSCRSMIAALKSIFVPPSDEVDAAVLDSRSRSDSGELEGADPDGLLALARGQLEELLSRDDNMGRQSTEKARPRLHDEHPRSVEDFVRLATRLFEEGHYAESAEYYAEAIAHGDGSAETRFQLAEALFNLGNFAQSILEYNAAIPALPKKATAYHQRGKACQAVGKFDDAIHDFTLAMEQTNPITQRSLRATFRQSLANVYCDRGQARMKESRHEEAINDFNKAIEIDKNFVDAYLGRGRAYHAKGAYAQAIEEYSEAIKRDGTKPSFFIARGQAHYAKATEKKRNVRLFRGVVIEEQDTPTTTERDRPAGGGRPGFSSQSASDSGWTADSLLAGASMLSMAKLESGKPLQYRGATKASTETKSQTELERAIRDYGRALELEPESIEAYQHRAEAQHALGQYLEAVRDYSQVIRRQARHDQAHFGLGQVHFDTENFQEAVDCFSQAIELNPDFPQGYYRRGMAQHHLGNFAEAVVDYSASIVKGMGAADPFFIKADPYFNRAEAEFLAGDYTPSIADYTEALQRGSESAVLYFKRGRAYRAAGNMSHAILDFQKAIAIEDTFSEAHASLADAYLATDEFSNALLHYANAAKVDTAQADRFRMLCARVYVGWGDFSFKQQNDPRKAKQKYGDAIEKHPELAEAHARLGVVHAAERDFEAALRCLDRAVELEGSKADLYYQRGEIYRQQQNFDAARGDFDKAIETDPQYLPSYLGRALVVAEMGNNDEAIGDLSYVLEREPYHLEANYEAGRLHRSVGRFDPAIFHLQRAAESNSHEKRYSSELGGALHERGNERYQHGDWDGAKDDFNAAIDYDPNSAEPYYSRARLRVASGEFDQALADVNAYIERGGADLEAVGAHALFELGHRHLLANDFDPAVDYFTQAIDQGYAHSIVYASRGTALAALSQLDPAIEDFENALNHGADEEVARKAGEAYRDRGLGFAHREQHEDAVRDFQRVLDLAPELREVLVPMGRAAFALGDLELAIDALDRSDDRSSETRELLASVCLKRGKGLFENREYERAYGDFDRAVTVSDESAESLYWRGLARRHLGANQIELMVLDLARASESNPESTRYRRGLALAHYELGLQHVQSQEWDQAIDAFSSSIEACSEHARVYVSRARALQALDKFQAACEDYDAAFQIAERRAGSRRDEPESETFDDPSGNLCELMSTSAEGTAW